MKNQPLVSVIIPTYNREKFLPLSINSVINQNYDDWELIVVDDRSTDGTKRLIEEYIKKYEKIRYIKNKHKQGPAGARNQGIEIAKGEFIAFLDSDDEWKKHHLKNIIGEFEKNKEVEWIFAYINTHKLKKVSEFFKENERIIIKKEKLFIFNGKKLLSFFLKYDIPFTIPTSIFRKKVFDKIRFDESLLATEDRLLILEAISKNIRIAYINTVDLIRHIHSTNISNCNPNKPIIGRIKVSIQLAKMQKKVLNHICLTKKQKKIVNKKLAQAYFWLLGYNSLRINNYEKANKYFLKALRLRPLNLKYWKTYIKRMILKIPLENAK